MRLILVVLWPFRDGRYGGFDVTVPQIDLDFGAKMLARPRAKRAAG